MAINSEAENDWLSAQFVGVYSEGYEGNTWAAAVQIGYYQTPTGEWAWINGDAVTFTSHHSSFPLGGTMAYLHTDSHPYAGTWNANPPHCEEDGYALTKAVIERDLQDPDVPDCPRRC